MYDGTVIAWGHDQELPLLGELDGIGGHPEPKEVPWFGGGFAVDIAVASPGAVRDRDHQGLVIDAEGDLWAWLTSQGCSAGCGLHPIDNVTTEPLVDVGVAEDWVSVVDAAGGGRSTSHNELGYTWLKEREDVARTSHRGRYLQRFDGTIGAEPLLDGAVAISCASGYTICAALFADDTLIYYTGSPQEVHWEVARP